MRPMTTQLVTQKVDRGRKLTPIEIASTVSLAEAESNRSEIARIIKRLATAVRNALNALKTRKYPKKEERREKFERRRCVRCFDRHIQVNTMRLTFFLCTA